MRQPPFCKVGLILALLLVGGGVRADEVRDLYFSEALYYAEQGYYFDALERLDAELGQHYRVDEPELDTLYAYIGQAEFFVGDFELNYRMHHRAGRAIRAVLEGDVDQEVRNEAAYRLARIQFQKGQMRDALESLDRIEGRMSPAIRDDVLFLRANVYLAIGRPSAAVDILRDLQGAAGLKGFSNYNLAIALLHEGESDNGLQQLDKAGQVEAKDSATRAIRDKANLTRGTMLLDEGHFDQARTALQRVHLEGPFANQALLGAGWADVNSTNFERAVVPWSALAQRDSTDAAVQEALLALPYAYSQLGVHGRAAVLYGQALDTFGGELDKLDDSIRSIREGKFLQALVREEIHQDKDWVVRLRALPETPETFYLVELLASHDFQAALDNYLDLEELRKKLAAWEDSFDAFDDIIDVRRAYYEPLLPGIDHEFRQLDSRIRLRLKQYQLLNKRLQDQLTMPRPEFLASTNERMMSMQLTALSEQLGAVQPDIEESPQVADLRARIDRLQGVLKFVLRTEYDERLNRFSDHLRELKSSIDLMNTQYEVFVRVRQAAVHSYTGYEKTIGRLRTRVSDAQATIGRLMARQGHLLERVAIRELETRQKRLERYQDQARYALADSYDRASRSQSGGE
jgi:predicted negative regulator of RcsB-dependent stress response